jgi:hypothetical protein
MTAYMDFALTASNFKTMITLMMEAVRTSETSVHLYESTRHNIPEGCELHFNEFHNFTPYALSIHCNTILTTTSAFSKVFFLVYPFDCIRFLPHPCVLHVSFVYLILLDLITETFF